MFSQIHDFQFPFVLFFQPQNSLAMQNRLHMNPLKLNIYTWKILPSFYKGRQVLQTGSFSSIESFKMLPTL